MSDAFRISLQDLRRQEGARIDLVRTIESPDFATDLVRTVGDLNIEGSLQSVSEGVLVTARVDYDQVSECARCLREIEEEGTADLAELYFYENRAKALKESGDEEAEELPLIVNDSIDLESLVRDTIVGQMPFIPLCEPDCPGLCNVCGERLAELPEDHFHETEEEPPSPLDELRAKLVAEEQEK